MVRLDAKQDELNKVILDVFQFLNGAIRWNYYFCEKTFTRKFQFLNGAIRWHVRGWSEYQIDNNFNSSMVRLDATEKEAEILEQLYFNSSMVRLDEETNIKA